MKLDAPQSEKLQSWLDRAANDKLDEDGYRQLLEELPTNPEERQFWLDQLRLSQSLKASVMQGKPGELQEILNQIPSRRSNPFGSPWIRSAAMVVASVGVLAVGLYMVPSSDETASHVSSAVATTLDDNEKLEELEAVFEEQNESDLNFDMSGKAVRDSDKATISSVTFGDLVADGAVTDDIIVEEELMISESSVVLSAAAPVEKAMKDIPSAGPTQTKGRIANNVKTDDSQKLNNTPSPTIRKNEELGLLLAKSTEKKKEVVVTQGLASASAVGGTYTITTPRAVAGVRGTVFDSEEGGERLRRQEAKVAKKRVAPPATVQAPSSPSGEKYVAINDHRFIHTSSDAKSTFSIDVDTASYANIRRMLRDGQLPNPDAVRVEEMINTFRYDYAPPTNGNPFSVHMDQTPAPWNADHRIVRVGLKGRIDLERPPVNLVFLLDVSGSMNQPDKLPLLKRSFSMLLNSLGEKDSVAIVAYAGHTGVVLDPTPATDRQKILQAMEKLRASGSTNGAGGVQLAYDLAKQSMIKDGVNRVILATDGDFNVGISNRNQLITFIEEKRRSGVELSVLGFGRGNIRDDVMESLANKGNGNYSYIDSVREARKALVEELDSNLVTIAKDVKIQVEFNTEAVKSFRLIGYENRKLAHKDFADDTKDAGEIGMGHSVTALYEIVPVSNLEDDSKLLTLNLRHKQPKGSVSELQSSDLFWNANPNSPSVDLKWALSVATWGQMLRNSEHLGKITPEDLLSLAREGRGNDPHGYRAEMIQLIESWIDLGGKNPHKNLPRWEFRR